MCRTKKDKRSLTRVVKTPDAGIVGDPTGKRNGRGAYICEEMSCWNSAMDGKVLARAFGVKPTADELKALAQLSPAARSADR